MHHRSPSERNTRNAPQSFYLNVVNTLTPITNPTGLKNTYTPTQPPRSHADDPIPSRPSGHASHSIFNLLLSDLFTPNVLVRYRQHSWNYYHLIKISSSPYPWFCTSSHPSASPVPHHHTAFINSMYFSPWFPRRLPGTLNIMLPPTTLHFGWNWFLPRIATLRCISLIYFTPIFLQLSPLAAHQP